MTNLGDRYVSDLATWYHPPSTALPAERINAVTRAHWAAENARLDYVWCRKA